MKITKELNGIKFGGTGCPQYTLDLPEGLGVSLAPEKGLEPAGYWLDEFPENIFPKGSMVLHDAMYRGIRLTEEQVKDKASRPKWVGDNHPCPKVACSPFGPTSPGD